MPISVPELVRNERTISVEIDGQEGEVTYRPGAMTPELEGVLTRASDPAQAVVDVMAELLIGWDVLDENGEVLPTDAETLAALPSSLISEIYRAITADMSDLREMRKNSGGGSRQAASREKHRKSSFSSKPQRS